RHFLGRGSPARAPGPVAAARGVDQPRGEALLVVNQDFQKMFGDKLLVALTDRQRLGGLNEAARPLGEFLDIHALSRSAPGSHGRLSPIHAPFWQRTIIRPLLGAAHGRYANEKPDLQDPVGSGG